MCWHKANFWTEKFQQGTSPGSLKNSEASPQNKIENNIQKWKQNEMLIQFHWENVHLLQSQLHDKESVYCTLN